MTSSKAASLIQKLLSRTEEAGATAAEAASCAAKAQELMLKHEMNLTDVEQKALNETDPMGQTYVSLRREGVPGGGAKRANWREDLARDIAQANFCRFMVVTGSDSIVFVGRESHREICKYLYISLARQLKRASDKEYRIREKAGDWMRGFIRSFRTGFISAVGNRMTEKRLEMEAAERAQADAKGKNFKDSTALIRISQAENATVKYMDSLSTVTAGGLNGGYGGGNGYGAGKRAGGSANLHGGVGRGSSRGPGRIGSGS